MFSYICQYLGSQMYQFISAVFSKTYYILKSWCREFKIHNLFFLSSKHLHWQEKKTGKWLGLTNNCMHCLQTCILQLHFCCIAMCGKSWGGGWQWILRDNFIKETPCVPWRTFTRRVKKERTFHGEEKPEAEVGVELRRVGKIHFKWGGGVRKKGKERKKRSGFRIPRNTNIQGLDWVRGTLVNGYSKFYTSSFH